ncbi:DHHC palmitoyltransferase [Giardia muris]|uniref:Palmitoyltransferase n=1 Tax=Giardia muris TaxID=5742 RepID=A0A4Z1SX24_GIAMU|nr:DHHC palmitoyltransferase [Giardia muris]|eukprot:TNJ28078.1 DHHC palmitoyltransferase [Giardia muris]
MSGYRSMRRCCRRRCIRGFDFICLSAILAIYVGYYALQVAFICSYSGRVLTPYVTYTVTTVLFCLCFGLQLATSLRDPGYMPCVTESRRQDNAPLVTVHVGQTIANAVYCSSCNVARPPGTSHCSDCEHCIVYFDHHCPWMGADIGLRNYNLFIWSLLGIAMYCIWTIVNAAICIFIPNNNTLLIVICILCFLGGAFGTLFGGGMLFSNLGLIRKDTSIRAYKRGRASAAEEVRNIKAKNELNLQEEVSEVSEQRTIELRSALGREGEDFVVTTSEFEEIYETISRLRGFKIKHPGWRRVFLGSSMPTLMDRPIQEAEKLAWVWTFVLCSEFPPE